MCTDYEQRDRVFTADASQGAGRSPHLPPLHFTAYGNGQVEPPSPPVRTQSIDRRRTSCGRVGLKTASADGVVMQLGGRDVRGCVECTTECVFSPRYFLISACEKLMIGGC